MIDCNVQQVYDTNTFIVCVGEELHEEQTTTYMLWKNKIINFLKSIY